MKCPNCGTENPAGKIVCRNCGTRLRVQPAGAVLVQQTEAQLMTRVRSDVRRILYVTGIVIVVGVILGYVIR